MAFRRTTVRRAPRKRAIWCNIPFGAVAFTESAGNQALLVPEDWEASFTGLSNERAVLRTIVGEVTIQQTVAGTLGTTGFWGIYMAGNDSPAAPAWTVTGMSDVDWLHVGSFGTQSTVSATSNLYSIAARQVHVKSKRKISTRDSIYICGQYGADAASPAAVLGGILRFLVARD